MQRSKTYFEQIPVAIVKKIAKEIPANNALENESVSVGTRDEATPGQEHWREVAQRVEREQDPNRMLGLIKRLVETFDEEKQRRAVRRCRGEDRL